MPERTLRIERLRVRLHGAPLAAGAHLGNVLGGALSTHLAPELARAAAGRAMIARLDIAVDGERRHSGIADPLESRVGAAVGATIAARLPARGGRP